MTTVYTAYDDDKPDSTQTGTAFSNSAKANLLALRDILIMFGMSPGWNYSYNGGTADYPTEMIFTRTVDSVVCKVKITNSWSGTTLQKCKFEYMGDGSTWDNLDDSDGNYVLNFTYDGSGTTWNATWA